MRAHACGNVALVGAATAGARSDVTRSERPVSHTMQPKPSCSTPIRSGFVEPWPAELQGYQW